MGVRGSSSAHFDILHSSRTGWDRCSGRGDPAEFGTLGSGAASRSTPARRGLIREKLLATRGKIATRYRLQPLSMLTCFLLSASNKDSDSKKRILAARWYIVIGTLWFGPGVAAVCNVFSGAIGFGGYLATAAAGAILLGGVLQISTYLVDL